MNPRRRLRSPIVLLLALCCAACSLVLGCHETSSGPSDAGTSHHRLGAVQIPAAQTGQGPIPEVTDATALASFPTTNMNSGFLAIAGTDVYAFSSTATIATDAGDGAGHAVVAGANGGTWLLVRSTSGTSLAVSQSGLYPLWTEGGATNLGWTSAAVLEVHGTLLANATVSVPNIPGMYWTVRNNCTGSFTLTIQTNGGSGFAVAEGKSATGYVDDEGGASGNFVRVGPDT